MSANVETCFVTKVPAWHGLGEVVAESPTSEDALRIAGLDWMVEPQPIFLEDGTKIDEKVANVRMSDKKVLGVVGRSYKIVQNKEAFAFVNGLLENDDVPVKFESAGSLDGGKRVWLLAHLPGRKIVGDEVIPYLVFTNPHTGGCAIKAAMTPTRVVCQNTLTMALNNAQRKWTIHHVGDINSKIREAQETLKLTFAYMDRFEEAAEVYQQIRVSNDQYTDILSIVFPFLEGQEGSRANYNIQQHREDVTEVYNNTTDLAQFRNTGWGVYNAFADFATHVEPLRKTPAFAFQEKRFASFIDGTNILPKVQKAIELVAA